MTATTFLLGAVGTGAGFVTDNPALILFGFCVLLVGFSLLLHRDYKVNVAATRAAPEHWNTLDDLYAWPTAAPGVYPPEEG